MIIYYGGLKFEVVRTIDFIRQPVFDETGVDYLYTKFAINVVALCNSQHDPYSGDVFQAMGMSYNQEGAFIPGRIDTAPTNVTRQSEESRGIYGSTPIITDTTIRHWLKVPRRALIITDSQGNELLRSPKQAGPFGLKDNFVCDANNGPKVSLYSIQEILGDARTFVVNFQVETYINECEEAENRSRYGLLAPLISNRFSQFHELDEDYFLTIVTQGKAHFRTDLVYKQTPITDGVNPDALRHYLFLPIPYGFKREDIKVWGGAAANELNYQFTDIQKPMQFVDGHRTNATRAVANYTEAIHSGDFDIATVINTVERAYNFSVNRKFKKSMDKETGTSKGKPVP